MPGDNQGFVEALGIDPDESVAAVEAVLAALQTEDDLSARYILAAASPETVSHIRDVLEKKWMLTLSETGKKMLVCFSMHSPNAISSLDKILNNLLSHPAAFKHLTIWCLFFAARDASRKLQITHCPSPTTESHLTGMLLEALSTSCGVWSKQVSRALLRSKASLTLQRIDLSILGGEQATGGDFGLVLELDGAIVPLVIQAKRYVRPNADVSQSHPIRGPQAFLLHKTKAASGYIFYENGREQIKYPLPPLLKSSKKIIEPTNTNVLSDSIDLPTFLLAAACDPKFAPTADSPEEALRMIYSRADPGQLAYLAVISSDSVPSLRYEEVLRQLAPKIEENARKNHTHEQNGFKP